MENGRKLQDAHPDDSGDRRQLVGQGRVHGTGGIQHGIGHVLFALVDHVFDVQTGLGGQRCDLAHKEVTGAFTSC